MTLQEIEQLTASYAKRRDTLSGLVGILAAELERTRRQSLPGIKRAIAGAADAHDKLRTAVAMAPALFERPRTRTFHGIKIGYSKQRGQVQFDDEPAVIARIRKLCPDEQCELLIRVRESVHRPAVYDLTAGDLKRLGIRITDDGDIVIIKPVDGEVDKLISALLKDAERVEDAA